MQRYVCNTELLECVLSQNFSRRCLQTMELVERTKVGLQEDASIPEVWHTTLRNSGLRFTRVGNMFTGLWIELKHGQQKKIRPQAIRRPVAVDSATRSGLSVILEGKRDDEKAAGRDQEDEEESYEGTAPKRRSKSPLLQQRLRESVHKATIKFGEVFTKPIDFTTSDLAQLCIRGLPLLEWAQTASPVQLEDGLDVLSPSDLETLTFTHTSAAIRASGFNPRSRPHVSDVNAAVAILAGKPAVASATYEGTPVVEAAQDQDAARQLAISRGCWSGVMEHRHALSGEEEVLAAGPHVHMQVLEDATVSDGCAAGCAVAHSGFLPSLSHDGSLKSPALHGTLGFNTAASLRPGVTVLPVSLQTSPGIVAVAKIRLVNTGTTALRFFW
jgi:hypothetical protein